MSTIGRPVDEGTRKIAARELQKCVAEIKHNLLVFPAKRDVGKGTVAVNLAVALAGESRKVGPLEVDMHGPSVSKPTGLEGQNVHADDTLLLPARVAGSPAVMSIGFLLSRKTDAVIWRGPLKDNVIREFLTDAAWGTLDYLPGHGNITLRRRSGDNGSLDKAFESAGAALETCRSQTNS